MKRSIVPIIMLGAFALCLVIGTGTASWVFSSPKTAEVVANVQVNEFKFGWTDSDLLDDETYGYSDKFQDLLNGMSDPNDTAGQALKKALAVKSNRNWLSNTDTNSTVSSNLTSAFPVSDDCLYLITKESNGDYCLYITYDDVSKYCDRSGNIQSQYIYTGRSPATVTCYKTIYKKDSSGNYAAYQSWVGTATLSYYDNNYTGQKQPSIYSGGFVSKY